MSTMRTALALVLSAAAWAQPPAPAPMVAPPPLRAAAALITDYGNLARYAADNQQVPAPAAGEERVVFMGDSITDGWGRNVQVPFFPGKPYINRGISGQTTAQMLLRFYPDVIALKPQGRGRSWPAPTTSAATSARSRWNPSRDNLVAMADMARANNIKVVLASLTPVCDYHRPADSAAAAGEDQRPEPMDQGILRAQSLRLSSTTSRLRWTTRDSSRLKSPMTACIPTRRVTTIMAPLAQTAIDQALKK